MEFLIKGQASLVFLFLIFILSFSILILFGFVFFKELEFSNLIIVNAKMFYNQFSILNLALNEIFINDYLSETEKSLTNEDLISFFDLPVINPEIKTISGFISTRSIKYQLEWKFNFTLDKEDQELKNLRIFILN